MVPETHSEVDGEVEQNCFTAEEGEVRIGSNDHDSGDVGMLIMRDWDKGEGWGKWLALNKGGGDGDGDGDGDVRRGRRRRRRR
jgi:hypothetical protein